ncbi:hypothetical protein ECTOBSL9_0792 [Ectothiorhodospira sp. BSL-9]|nr:hypothetical protein ECTOBSL9_0792 [Ectothiorhodospira sp. BSL-9]
MPHISAWLPARRGCGTIRRCPSSATRRWRLGTAGGCTGPATGGWGLSATRGWSGTISGRWRGPSTRRGRGLSTTGGWRRAAGGLRATGRGRAIGTWGIESAAWRLLFHRLSVGGLKALPGHHCKRHHRQQGQTFR